MCYFQEIIKYNCRHEEVTDYRELNFCLFNKNNSICTQEMGAFRLLNANINNWCINCTLRLPEVMRTKDKSGRTNYPRPTRFETQNQINARHRLRMACGFPPSCAKDRRQLLHATAHSNLREILLKSGEKSDVTYGMLLKYIASLPPWMNRIQLVDEMEPNFGRLLNEDEQICLRPILRSMECENRLDDLMLWTRDPIP
ncbi:hypothetical protein M426DRAFT_10994 [Hypoxylon sp. CI-4A]|nr:hypothetical protein M426DRAFT_10994 [Hypoxylon sp. CI-4A]